MSNENLLFKRDLTLHEAMNIVEKGVDIHCVDMHNQTPLFYIQNLDVIKYLISHGMNPLHENMHNETLIFRQHSLDIVKYYMSIGLDINHQNFDGHTVLFLKDDYDDEVLDFFVKNMDLNLTDKLGASVLFYETSHKRIQLMIESGANIHHTCDKNRNALFYVNNKKTIDLYIKNNIEINLIDVYGFTALDRFYSSRLMDITRQLINAGGVFGNKQYYHDNRDLFDLETQKLLDSCDLLSSSNREFANMSVNIKKQTHLNINDIKIEHI